MRRGEQGIAKEQFETKAMLGVPSLRTREVPKRAGSRTTAWVYKDFSIYLVQLPGKLIPFSLFLTDKEAKDAAGHRDACVPSQHPSMPSPALCKAQTRCTIGNYFESLTDTLCWYGAVLPMQPT